MFRPAKKLETISEGDEETSEGQPTERQSKGKSANGSGVTAAPHAALAWSYPESTVAYYGHIEDRGLDLILWGDGTRSVCRSGIAGTAGVPFAGTMNMSLGFATSIPLDRLGEDRTAWGQDELKEKMSKLRSSRMPNGRLKCEDCERLERQSDAVKVAYDAAVTETASVQDRLKSAEEVVEQVCREMASFRDELKSQQSLAANYLYTLESERSAAANEDDRRQKDLHAMQTKFEHEAMQHRDAIVAMKQKLARESEHYQVEMTSIRKKLACKMHQQRQEEIDTVMKKHREQICEYEERLAKADRQHREELNMVSQRNQHEIRNIKAKLAEADDRRQSELSAIKGMLAKKNQDRQAKMRSTMEEQAADGERRLMAAKEEHAKDVSRLLKEISKLEEHLAMDTRGRGEQIDRTMKKQVEDGKQRLQVAKEEHINQISELQKDIASLRARQATEDRQRQEEMHEIIRKLVERDESRVEAAKEEHANDVSGLKAEIATLKARLASEERRNAADSSTEAVAELESRLESVEAENKTLKEAKRTLRKNKVAAESDLIAIFDEFDSLKKSLRKYKTESDAAQRIYKMVSKGNTAKDRVVALRKEIVNICRDEAEEESEEEESEEEEEEEDRKSGPVPRPRWFLRKNA